MLSAKIEGLDAVLDALGDVDRKVKKKLVRRGINDGTRVILAAMKARVPVGKTKLLKKSLGRKIKTYRSGTVVGIVGPRKGFRREARLKNGRTVVRDPVRYAHLAERKHPFARPAADESRAPVVAAMTAALQSGL